MDPALSKDLPELVTRHKTMSRKYTALLTLLNILMDAAMVALAFYLAYALRSVLPFPSPLRLGPFPSYLGQMAIHVASLLVTFLFYRLYHLEWGHSRIDLFYTVLSAVSIGMLAATAVSYLFFRPAPDIARGIVAYTWALSTALVPVGRALTNWLRGRVRLRYPEHLLLVGTGETARTILQKTEQSPRLGYQVLGFVDGRLADEEIRGVPVLGPQTELARIVREHGVREVIVALPEATHEELLDIISACESEHATVRIFPDLFQIIASDLKISDFDGLPLLTVRDVALRGWRLTLKRCIDLIASSIGLVVLSPFLLLIALAVKLESKGDTLYSQVRVGLDGKPFDIIKFRTMRADAEANSGPTWATENDPRRTRVGAFLRSTSIDELPQLINVLLGEMSLVGPRPERPVFVDQFQQLIPRYIERHKEKAGLTGWAQVNGLRGDTSIIERTKYGLYYIENWSLLFDLKILLRTFINWFRRDRDAY